MHIEEYNDNYHLDILEAIKILQEYEYNISAKTRIKGSDEFSKNYFTNLKCSIEINNGKIFIAQENNKFLGFICYYFMQDDNIAENSVSNNYAYISDICVLPEFRGKDVAKKLFQKIHVSLKEKGFTGFLRLNSLAENDIAKNCYLKNGFKIYEITYQKEITFSE